MLVWIGTKFGSRWLQKTRKLNHTWKKDQLPTCDNLRDLIRGLYF